MDSAEFDKYAEAYERQLAENIAITGESPSYFAEYKVAATRTLADSAGLDPAVILDFGAGIGNSTGYFKHYFPDASLLSADVSRKSLDLLERRHPGQSRRVEMDHTIPLDDKSIDLAFTACVFHHVREAEHAHWLAELARVVRPGGLFVLFEHNPLNPFTQRAVSTCPFDENATLIRAGVMARRLSEAGWPAPRIHHRVFFPRALAALRPLETWLTWLPFGGQYSLCARR